VEQGSYLELKGRNVNFSAWVTDVVHHDDDPNGVIENMSEIRLDPSTSTNQPSTVSPLRPINETLMHLQLRKSKPRSSPLASEKPINADQATIKQLIEMNSSSLQNTNLNEHAISKMIERGQNSVLTGNSMRPPTNFANQDIVTRTIEANHLTVHSLHNFDVGTMEAGDDVESKSPYFQFFRDYPGEWVGYFFLFLFLTSHAFRFISDVWLVFLVDQKGPEEYERNIIILACLCTLIVLSIMSRGFAFLRMVAKKGSFWHSKILESVLQAPMSFYDITPLGHILSFFAKHLFSVDEILPDTAMQVLTFLPLVFGAMTVACIYVPWLWATLPLYFAGWIFVSSICISSQNIFKHLEASNKSPMFAHLSTTLEGLFLIRLYHTEERFDYFNRTLIDADHKALYSLLLVRGFMSLCLDIISCFFIYFTALFIVLFEVRASHSGIALTNALQLLLFVPWLVKMIFELDSSMSSVSSLIYFGEKAPKEVF
jgi:ABC-type bacteriocin/lantibiotic exporter with double-glycine peptidase domain